MIKKKNLKGNFIFFYKYVIIVALIFIYFCSTLGSFNGGLLNVGTVMANGKVESDNDFNFSNLIVFFRFKGESEFVFDDLGGVSVSEVVENSYERGEYSVNDYYFSASNGKVKMKNIYLFANGGSLELEKERGYYCAQDTFNPIGYTSSEYGIRMYELKQDWSNAVQKAVLSGATISNYEKTVNYSIADLDRNNDGLIDALTIIYKYSDKYAVSWKDCLWNYQDYYNGVTLTSGSKTITSGAYLQFTANFNYLYSDSDGRKFSSLKTMIHETGHIFGLKDLYRSSMTSRVYYMSAMSNAITPVPQYISAKEREALGWLNDGNLIEISEAGIYTVNVTSSQSTDGVICYKIPLASRAKTLYLEYRDFSSGANKYDLQAKNVYNADGNKISPISIKSGLVCFLSDKDTRFPNNLYTYGSNWNYEVLGGVYNTKSDAALGVGESLMATLNLTIEVISIENGQLTFKVVGTDIEKKHVHSTEKKEYKAANCLTTGNIEYWYCSSCGKYFSDELLKNEISESDTVIGLTSCVGKVVKGYAPTCSKTGLTDGEECAFCGKTLIERKEIAKLAHTLSDWIVLREASPNDVGLRVIKCLVCEEIIESETFEYQGETESGLESESGDSSESESGSDNESGDSSESESGSDSESGDSSDSESNGGEIESGSESESGDSSDRESEDNSESESGSDSESGDSSDSESSGGEIESGSESESGDSSESESGDSSESESGDGFDSESSGGEIESGSDSESGDSSDSESGDSSDSESGSNTDSNSENVNNSGNSEFYNKPTISSGQNSDLHRKGCSGIVGLGGTFTFTFAFAMLGLLRVFKRK